MKKKILSEAALQAMMTAGDEPVVEPTAEVPVAEPAVVEPEAAETENEVEIPDPMEALQAELSEVREAAKTREAEMVANLAEAEAKLTEMEASTQALKDIVAGQVSTMRIGLRFAAVDMSKFSIDALVTEYENTAEAFMKALPVGSVVPEPKVEKTSPISSSHDAGSFKALGFK
jgi:hypothetical protein